jgi:hypothetical protein
VLPFSLLALVLLAGGGWGAYLISSLGGDGAGDAVTTTTAGKTTVRTQTTAKAVTTAAELVPVAGVTAASYDPRAAGGDGDEHPGDTANALDGQIATSWRTDTYRASAVFGGVKPGVGLILTAPTAVAARSLRLDGGVGGWTGRVYSAAGTEPPATIAGWKPASAPFLARTVPMDIPLTGGPSRHYLVWITKLAAVDNGFAASIAEAHLQAAAKAG